MESLKMKDLFDFCVCFEVRGGHISNRYEEITEAQADYIEDATNNHDRLVEENAELRKALVDLLECKGIHTSDKECVINAKKLLNK